MSEKSRSSFWYFLSGLLASTGVNLVTSLVGNLDVGLEVLGLSALWLTASFFVAIAAVNWEKRAHRIDEVVVPELSETERKEQVKSDKIARSLGRKAWGWSSAGASMIILAIYVVFSLPLRSPKLVPSESSNQKIWVVYFDVNKSNIPVSGRSAIRNAAKVAETYSTPLVLLGSTDTIGPEIYNKKLAQQRISSVRSVLNEDGFIAIPVIEILLNDDHRPITTIDEVSEPMNRCVFLISL